MNGDRIINMGGGIYNETIHGNAINIQGNSVSVDQDLPQIAIKIYQQLVNLQNQGDAPEVARLKVATQLATEANQQPATKSRLQQLGQYLRTEAANGLIGEAAVMGVKAVLGLIGIPLP